jgi:hypothetical protein
MNQVGRWGAGIDRGEIIMAIVATVHQTTELQILRLVNDCPRKLGRKAAARIVSGLELPFRAIRIMAGAQLRVERYVSPIERDHYQSANIIDGMIRGGLIAQTRGPWPGLYLTPAGEQRLADLTA